MVASTCDWESIERCVYPDLRETFNHFNTNDKHFLNRTDHLCDLCDSVQNEVEQEDDSMHKKRIWKECVGKGE